MSFKNYLKSKLVSLFDDETSKEASFNTFLITKKIFNIQEGDEVCCCCLCSDTLITSQK